VFSTGVFSVSANAVWMMPAEAAAVVLMDGTRKPHHHRLQPAQHDLSAWRSDSPSLILARVMGWLTLLALRCGQGRANLDTSSSARLLRERFGITLDDEEITALTA